jgi:glycosyltransferase involved in cell wall biosynthesis
VKARILFFMATGSPVGGVATWLDRASHELSLRGYDPVVGLVRGLKNNDPDRYRDYHPELQTVVVDGRGMDRNGRILACLLTIRRVKPQVVLPLGVLDANDAAMRAKARGHNLRVVGRAQGNLAPMLADLHDYRDGLDHVVCVGELTRRFLIRHAEYEPDRVDHIPNGADPAISSRVDRIPGSPLRLGYIGRLSKNDKRVLDIPLFCHALSDRGIPFNMTIVGTGPCENELGEKLQPLGDRVKMTGSMKTDAVYSKVLPYLDALLLFSSSETFGIVLVEAMMNGVVPVTSRYLGFQCERLVVDEKHGLSFPVGDVTAAAEAVNRLNNDQSLLSSLSKSGRMHASDQYTWGRCFSRWDEVLQQTLQREPVQAPGNLLHAPSQNSGLLNRWNCPPVVSDSIRRFRRMTVGVPVPPGGEEWPLFRRNHPDERLKQIQEWCKDIESSIESSTRKPGSINP